MSKDGTPLRRTVRQAAAQLKREAWQVGKDGPFPAHEPPTPRLQKLENLTPSQLEAIPWAVDRAREVKPIEVAPIGAAEVRKIGA